MGRGEQEMKIKGRRETFEVMKTFIILVVVMGSWVCTYVKLIQLCSLNRCSSLYVGNTSIMLFFKKLESSTIRIWTHVSDVKPLRSWQVIQRPPFLAGDIKSVHTAAPPGCLPVPLHRGLWLFRNCLPRGFPHPTLLPAFRICQWFLSPLGDFPLCPPPCGPSNVLPESRVPELGQPGFDLHQPSDLGWSLYLFEPQIPHLNDNSSSLEIALRIK